MDGSAPTASASYKVSILCTALVVSGGGSPDQDHRCSTGAGGLRLAEVEAMTPKKSVMSHWAGGCEYVGWVSSGLLLVGLSLVVAVVGEEVESEAACDLADPGAGFATGPDVRGAVEPRG